VRQTESNSILPPSLTHKHLWPVRDQIELIEKERASKSADPDSIVSFDDWLPVVTPAYFWRWPHLDFIKAQLNRVTSGEIRRIILSVPPRHGKSELVTVRYSAWFLENDPTRRVIVGAYNQTLANKFSRKIRRIAETRIPLSKERNAAEDWETQEGGGCRAVGVGSGVTGMGGDLLIIDDPVKNREEANSPTYRDKVWDWFRDDLYTRCEPGASIILIMTRWHEDDLAGRILAGDDKDSWTGINLPALAEDDDPLNRPLGAALCPERYDATELASIRTVLGNSFNALYQGSPLPLEGGMFKRPWFEIVGASPAQATRVRFWDKAGTEGGDGARTAGVKMARAADGLFYIEDVVSGRWSAHQRETVIKQTAEMDGRSVAVWVEQEPGSGGKESAENTIRNLAGWTVRADRVTGDKATRAEPLAAQCEAGNVKLVKGDWNSAFLDELTVFPQGKYKDQTDAASGAFNKLAVNQQWRSRPLKI
jgi:predicted phage terminase large subunit-like protein